MRKKICALLLVVALALGLGLVPLATVSASPAPAIAGLWHLDSDASDSSGNSNDGSLMGDAYFVAPGYFGLGAVSLDGNGDYVTVPDSVSLDITDVMTVEAWIKIDSYTSGKVYTIAGKWNDIDGNYRAYLLALSTKETGHPLAKFYVSTNGTNFYSAVAPSDQPLSLDTWYHLVGTFDGTKITIGFDEMEKGSYTFGAATSIAANNEPLLIGGNKAGGSGGNGFFDGLIEEVRIWHSVPLDFEVSATPIVAYNPVTVSEHSITATVDPVAPGAVVHLEVIDGPNVGATDDYGESDQTDNNGEVTLSYVSNGNTGVDTIRVWVDLNWNGAYDEGIDNYAIVAKVWLENYVTGGGTIKMSTLGYSGNKPALTFAGTVGVLEGAGIVGQFQIVDHTGLIRNGAVSWHCDNAFTLLSFEGDPTESPDASHDTAIFEGEFTSNLGDTETILLRLVDNGEPGAGSDTLSVWVFGDWLELTIDGGNIQVHDIEE